MPPIYFCPLSVDWGTVADWVQGLGSVGAIVAAIVVWRSQSRTTRKLWKKQARLTRKAQRESLRPHLSLIARTQSVNEDLPHIELSLDNNGLGPAIVKSIHVFHNDALVQGSWEEISRQVLLEVRRDIAAERTTNDSCPDFIDDWIPSGKSFRIFQWTFHPVRPNIEVFGNENSELRAAIALVRVDIQYESTFGEEFRTSTHA